MKHKNIPNQINEIKSIPRKIPVKSQNSRGKKKKKSNSDSSFQKITRKEKNTKF